MSNVADPSDESTRRVMAIIEDLDAFAEAGDSPLAVLQSGAVVVECARLAANRSALYAIASGLLRASVCPGKPINLGNVFVRDSEYYLTEVELQEQPAIKPVVPEGGGLRLGNKLLGVALVLFAALALLGAVSLLRPFF